MEPEQLSFFHTFGYLAIPALFRADEMGWISEEFERAMQSEFAGKAYDGPRRTTIVPIIDHSERLCTLLDDPRILEVATAILGADFNYASGDGNYKSGDTQWHADGNYPELFAIKIAFYLDSLQRDNGCLRVLPGSHWPDSIWRAGQLNPRQAAEQWGIDPGDIPGNVALETQPGDLVVFNHNTQHGAFGGGKSRRMFAMNLHKRARTAGEMERVDGYVRGHCPVSHGFKIGGMYTDLMLDTATPQRLVHLEQLFDRHVLVHPEDTRPRSFPGR